MQSRLKNVAGTLNRAVSSAISRVCVAMLPTVGKIALAMSSNPFSRIKLLGLLSLTGLTSVSADTRNPRKDPDYEDFVLDTVANKTFMIVTTHEDEGVKITPFGASIRSMIEKGLCNTTKIAPVSTAGIDRLTQDAVEFCTSTGGYWCENPAGAVAYSVPHGQSGNTTSNEALQCLKLLAQPACQDFLKSCEDSNYRVLGGLIGVAAFVLISLLVLYCKDNKDSYKNSMKNCATRCSSSLKRIWESRRPVIQEGNPVPQQDINPITQPACSIELLDESKRTGEPSWSERLLPSRAT